MTRKRGAAAAGAGLALLLAGAALIRTGADPGLIYPGARLVALRPDGSQTYATPDSPERVAAWYATHLPGSRPLALLDNPNSRPGIAGSAGWNVALSLPFTGRHLVLGRASFVTTFDAGSGTQILVHCAPRCPATPGDAWAVEVAP